MMNNKFQSMHLEALSQIELKTTNIARKQLSRDRILIGHLYPFLSKSLEEEQYVNTPICKLSGANCS